jgi:hypothetical protein
MKTELRKGDSGSWVIDANIHNILGYVVAISAGSAYLIPLTDLFEQIIHVLKPEGPIRLPSPFRLLSSLARYHFALEPAGHKPLSNYYASEVLRPEALNSPSSEETLDTQILLKSAIRQGEDRLLLIRLISSVEPDLWPILGSYSTWSLENQSKIDRDLAPMLIRMQNRLDRSNSELEINLIPPLAPVPRKFVIEDEKTPQGN